MGDVDLRSKLRGTLTGTAVGPGGIAKSAASGNGTISTNTPTNITNQSVDITATGRGIRIELQPATVGTEGYVAGNSAATGLFSIIILLLRGGSEIARFRLGGNQTGSWAPASVSFLDLGASVGVHTYSVQYYADTVGFPDSEASYKNVCLVAYEE